MDVLRSRILLRPGDLDRSRRFYRDVMAWPFTGSSARRAIPGWCSSSARGLLEVSGHAVGSPGRSVMIWIQVREFTPSMLAWSYPPSDPIAPIRRIQLTAATASPRSPDRRRELRVGE